MNDFLYNGIIFPSKRHQAITRKKLAAHNKKLPNPRRVFQPIRLFESITKIQ